MPETIAPGRDFRRHWRRLGRRIWLNTPAIAPAADSRRLSGEESGNALVPFSRLMADCEVQVTKRPPEFRQQCGRSAAIVGR
jgi:hypothetical protein